MAKIGIKGLTYAPYTSGGEGGAISYGTGVKLDDYMIRADLTEERTDTPFYADDHKIDRENSMSGISLSLELSNMTDALEKALLGYADGAVTGELNVTDEASPFVGVGFIRKERFKGAITYKGYWIYKIQFGKDSDSTQTKGETVDFQTETLNGAAVGVQLTSGGKTIYYTTIRKNSEADARTWLNGKAGIT
jgi:phi13 family phage major tail protein